MKNKNKNDWSQSSQCDITNKGLEKVIIHLKKSYQKDAFFIDMPP